MHKLYYFESNFMTHYPVILPAVKSNMSVIVNQLMQEEVSVAEDQPIKVEELDSRERGEIFWNRRDNQFL